MKPALLLVDLQADFLNRQALEPKSARLVPLVKSMLQDCRSLGVPVLHVHTQISADGSDCMPHWQRAGLRTCVRGTSGAMPPAQLQPTSDELIIAKQFFSGFSNSALDAALRNLDVDTVVVAGLYLDSCVRATVLDAYQRGYEVWVVDDAVASTEPEHAEITRRYLHGRAATFLDSPAVLVRLGKSTTKSLEHLVPAASINGRWLESGGQTALERRNPSDWNAIIASIPLAQTADVHQATQTAARVVPEWSHTPRDIRAELLEAWARALQQQRNELAELLALEIGKPVTAGGEEVGRAIAMLRAIAQSLEGGSSEVVGPVRIHARPHGVVALITPWNNPVAIPVAKIAAAIAYGNGVVWKPAIEAPRIAMKVLELLHEHVHVSGLVNLVFGEATTARYLIDDPLIMAISLTGSTASGRSAAVRCSRLGKPLQAEMGGNNAAVVLRDCDLASHARGMALAAFSFAGQRCTSIQRFIVDQSIFEQFMQEFVVAVESLVVGQPSDPATEVGPLVSRAHRHVIKSLVDDAISAGAQVQCGGEIPKGFEQGCWLSPTVLSNVDPEHPLALDEAFGPLAVIESARDLKEAIELANRVRYGLVATLYSENEESRRTFAEQVKAGIVNVACEPLDIHPQAPFGGWKASSIGPPEHGRWDREFYTRPQAVYGGKLNSSAAR